MRLKLDHQNVWFTSDLHFCHANVIKYDGRPYKNVEEMHEALIENWNHYIAKDDVVFYLGDLSFDKNGKQTQELVNQLKGKIHYILGNHDKEKDIRKINFSKGKNDQQDVTSWRPVPTSIAFSQAGEKSCNSY